MTIQVYPPTAPPVPTFTVRAQSFEVDPGAERFGYDVARHFGEVPGNMVEG
ncbi:hypothetical protein BJ994_001322 [Arthrobacter pigmenti]|uniref:Uncharacterized protein n=1 Tax=Arthrobacter pigmenti TaxID=271432 RepID=A0A846RT47_9MICC|nr:hypothetical protein [Arthrobacter pigmenti]NJC22246.1 hypothetical protein [Arthrobacter pigmenti]